MVSFQNDYNSVGHPEILRALQEASIGAYCGYGMDDACEGARDIIRSLIGNSGAQAHFLIGGTQANLTALAAFLRPHEAAISAASAHINGHETGAVEATGHKILITCSKDGKIAPEGIRDVVSEHSNEHSVKPRLVFISQSTEFGTLYSLDELRALRQACNELGLLLYLDGARLGAALASQANDASLRDIAELTDAFYIGGTKNGLLFGEALIINNPSIGDCFRYVLKQRGGMLAKGFLLGIQFQRAFSDGLYFEVAKVADLQAEKLRSALVGLGVRFAVDSPTNQLFPVLRNETVTALSEDFLFEIWSRLDKENTVIRLVTTWRTTDDEIELLVEKISKAL
jgi:threonine aldolase